MRLLIELIHLIVSTFSPAFKILSPTHAVFISCQDNQPLASGRDQDPGFLPQRPRRDHRGLVACSDVWSTSCESDLGLQSLGCSRFYFCLIFVVFLNICVDRCVFVKLEGVLAPYCTDPSALGTAGKFKRA